MTSLLSQISFHLSSLGHFWQEKFNGQVFRWNLLIIASQIIYLLINFNNLPPQVVLYFSLPWGESRLTSASALFLLPSLAIIILLVNNLLAAFLVRQLPLLSRLLVIFSIVFSLFSAISLINIINLVL